MNTICSVPFDQLEKERLHMANKKVAAECSPTRFWNHSQLLALTKPGRYAAKEHSRGNPSIAVGAILRSVFTSSNAMNKPVNEIVSLRQVQVGDLERMYEFEADSESNRMAATIPRPRDKFISHWEQVLLDSVTIARAVSVNDVLAGYICCFKMDEVDAVGYWLGEEFWGRGIASEALKMLIDEVSIRPLHAYVATSNQASLRVLQKCGFEVVSIQQAPATARLLECEEATLVLT